jgi:creatinine amidohydrolase
MDAARALPDVAISLSDGIKGGKSSFRAMGIDRAYTGAPREASAEEGSEMLDRLAQMILTEVEEGLAALKAAPPSDDRSSRADGRAPSIDR